MSRTTTPFPLLGLLLPLAACVLQWLLWPVLQPFAWILFYPTVFFCCRYGGRAAGFASTLLSALLVLYVFLPPEFSLGGKSPAQLASVIVFLLTGLLLGAIQEPREGAPQGAAQSPPIVAQGGEKPVHPEQEASHRGLWEQERLTFALEAIHTGVWDLNLNDHTVYRSLEQGRIFGDQEPLPPWSYQRFLEHVLPEDREEVDARFRKALAERGELRFETRILRADGAVRWIWVSARHRCDAPGLWHLAGVVQDITERRAGEERLRRRNEELERFELASVERELQMIRLKHQVNGLAVQLGEEPPYDLSFAEGLVAPDERGEP